MINALKYVEELEQTGFTSEQAKTSVTTWLELMNDNLATKKDLKELQIATTSELSNVRHEMKEGFSAIRLEMKNEFASVRIEMKEMENRLNNAIYKSAGFAATIIGIFVIVGKYL